MAGPASHKVHAADPADPAHGEPNGMRLRLARQARGFSQQQLAGMAGVSRQAVSAVESGLSDPSLRVALALARALGLTVEEMFGPRAPAPQVDARPLAPLGDGGGRVTLAPIGDTLVALPLSGAAVSRAGFVPADGIAAPAGAGPADGVPAGGVPAGGVPADGVPAGGARADAARADAVPAGPAGSGGPGHSIRPLSPPRPTLVVAGCDPAIPLLGAPLGLLDPPVSLAWWQCASGEALDLAARGLVHVAGAHLRGREGDYNVGSARTALPRGAQIMGFCSWREGLVLRSGLAAQVSSVADVVRAGLRLVNREPGSEARLLLDRELAALGAGPPPGYRSQATGHLHVASAIAAGLADVGVASEPAALAYGLDFIPLAEERFDLVIPADRTGSREAQALLKVLSSRWLLDQLTSLPGYDPARCGELIATLPPSGPGPVPGPLVP